MANAEKLTDEWKAAGLPGAGCASDGRISWSGPSTQAQRDQAAAIVLAHDPAQTRAQKARELPMLPLDLAAVFVVAADGALAPAWARDRVRACAEAAKAALP